MEIPERRTSLGFGHGESASEGGAWHQECFCARHQSSWLDRGSYGIDQTGHGQSVVSLVMAFRFEATRTVMFQMSIQIEGLILLGTSIDDESERSRKLGCWDVLAGADQINAVWTSSMPTPDFELLDALCEYTVVSGMGKEYLPEKRTFWRETMKNYKGDDGCYRIRMCWINLATRDGVAPKAT